MRTAHRPPRLQGFLCLRRHHAYLTSLLHLVIPIITQNSLDDAMYMRFASRGKELCASVLTCCALRCVVCVCSRVLLPQMSAEEAERHFRDQLLFSASKCKTIDFEHSLCVTLLSTCLCYSLTWCCRHNAAMRLFNPVNEVNPCNP